MTKLAKVLTSIAMIVLLFLLIVAYGVHLQVSLIEPVTIPALDQPEVASELIESARSVDLGSDLFSRPTSQVLSQYKLVQFQVKARNIGVLPAEWLHIRIVPSVGDIAISQGETPDVRPFGGEQVVSATLLTQSEGDATRRDVRLEYYIFGRRMEVSLKGV